MKVAPKVLLVPLSLRERAGVRETVMTPGRFHVEGVTPGVMTVGVGGSERLHLKAVHPYTTA